MVAPSESGGRPVPRRRVGRWKLCCSGQRHGRLLGSLLVSRLRGTAALQVRDNHRSLVHGIWRASGPSAPCWAIKTRGFKVSFANYGSCQGIGFNSPLNGHTSERRTRPRRTGIAFYILPFCIVGIPASQLRIPHLRLPDGKIISIVPASRNGPFPKCHPGPD